MNVDSKTMNPSGIGPQVILIVIGAISGLAFQFDWWAAKGWFGSLQNPSSLIFLLRTALLSTVALFALRTAVRWVVQRLPLPFRIKSNYPRYDTLTYSVFLLFLLGIGGIQLSIPFIYVLGFAFVAAQLLLAFLLLKNTQEGDRFFLSLGWVSFLFLLSGVAALIYQVVWQRLLFAAYGVNTESVTIIVSIFMFGLGVGSLVGGILSKRFPSHLPQLFVLCELAIGSFGIASLPLINWITDATVHGSLLSISLVTYSVLCLPTVFMGATLPILVSYLHSYYKHVGKSVGTLYFFNTIGSAIASLVTVDVLFVFWGQQATVFIAAMFNFVVALLVFVYCQKLSCQTPKPEVATEPAPDFGLGRGTYSISYTLTLFLAGATGYVSLSQEIVWMRVISYASGGMPQVFGHILGFFLFGVAAGALAGKRICEDNKIRPLNFISWIFLATALFYYVSIPLCSYVIEASWKAGMLVSYLTVAIVALLLGSIFPVLCHFGIRSDTAVGLSLSGIYMANILGSTAGPLITGFVLMNYLTMEQIVLYLSTLSLVMAAGVGLLGADGVKARAAVLSSAALALLVLFVLQDATYGRVLERLQFHKAGLKQNDFKYVVQNRSGIIAVEPGKNGDIIYGGGALDGSFSIDPIANEMGIQRAYMLAALHSNPEEVLEIGAASGSWTRVMAAHSGVKQITVVEINSGYLDLIKKYQDFGTLLSNPKIRYYLDDGRRWLKRNPEARFDVIVMMTIYHWRSSATNLLSKEFLEMCRDHLKEGGVVYLHPTMSQDVAFTAANVFRYVTQYGGLVAASDRPFEIGSEERRRNLLMFQEGNRVILDGGDTAMRTVLDQMVGSDLRDQGEKIRRRADLSVITEDNMLTEYKRMQSPISYLYRWYDPRLNWKEFLSYDRDQGERVP